MFALTLGPTAPPATRSPSTTKPRIFQSPSRAERVAFNAHYLDHLRARNGLPRFETRTFTIRETMFRDLEAKPVRRTGRPVVDPAVFAENHLRRAPWPGLDEPTLFALC